MNINYQKVLLALTGVAVATPVFAKKQPQKEGKQPNVLIIFTDDQGYADMGCFGNTQNRTPVIDQLYAEGMHFTNFYAQPVSGASRAALLTGRYPARNGGKDMVGSETTLAEYAKSAGYQTACIGKWDLSGRKPVIEQMPNAQGFDYYYGPIAANDGGFIDIYENNKLVVKRENRMDALLKMYTDKAIHYLTEQRDKDKPFVLYLAHTMMHVVIGASEDFKGKSKGGLYGDVVEEFDYETGRLLKTLKDLGLEDDTIIIYATDNGPWCQKKYTQRKNHLKNYPAGSIFWGDPGELRAGKGSAYEGGSRVQCIIKWDGVIEAGSRRDGLAATIDFVPTLAKVMGYKIPSYVRMDGVDQSPMIFGRSDKSQRKNFCYIQHNHISRFVAIRDERWKLLLPDRQINTIYLMDFGTNDYELYDLKNDIGEKNNVADKYPKIVERLEAELQKVY